MPDEDTKKTGGDQSKDTKDTQKKTDIDTKKGFSSYEYNGSTVNNFEYEGTLYRLNPGKTYALPDDAPQIKRMLKTTTPSGKKLLKKVK